MSKYFPRYREFNGKPYQLKYDSVEKASVLWKQKQFKKDGWKTRFVKKTKKILGIPYPRFALYARKD